MCTTFGGSNWFIMKTDGSIPDHFKVLHSEIMMYFQCIEYDLKCIYSAMSAEYFDDNMDMLETANLGKTIRKLQKLDESDGKPWLTKSDYEQLNRIREIRNYWAHQCYLDFIYMDDDQKKAAKMQKIYNRLDNEHRQIYNLHCKIENLYYRWCED